MLGRGRGRLGQLEVAVDRNGTADMLADPSKHDITVVRQQFRRRTLVRLWCWVMLITVDLQALERVLHGGILG